jgi:Heat shock protein
MKKRLSAVLSGVAVSALLFLTVACGGDRRAELAAHEWSLQGVIHADSTSSITVPPGVTIRFSDSTRVVGRGGCNGFSGQYELGERAEISIGTLGSTMMWCMNMPFEDAYLKMLEGVERFEVSETELVLHGAGGRFTLVYEPSQVNPE